MADCGFALLAYREKRRILVSFCDFLAGISQKRASRQEIGKSPDETRRMRGNQGNSHQMSC